MTPAYIYHPHEHPKTGEQMAAIFHQGTKTLIEGQEALDLAAEMQQAQHVYNEYRQSVLAKYANQNTQSEQAA